jgi:tetratricopeptide (TPR) repeat protein
MSAKATELMSASGSTDPIAYVNQGIILWNQSKTPEAKAQFLKATELDPKYPDAHYWLGMALVNEGNMPEAGTHMKEYLALAPTGQYADTAKAILDSIK